MYQSGLDKILLEKRMDEHFVYAGYSAGACILTPTLKGLHLVDNIEIVPKGYIEKVLWDGLCMIPFSIAPHYRSNHPESQLIEKSVEYFIENKMLFIALRDGEVHITDSQS